MDFCFCSSPRILGMQALMRLWSVAFQPRTQSNPTPAATCKCGTGRSPLPNGVASYPSLTGGKQRVGLHQLFL